MGSRPDWDRGGNLVGRCDLPNSLMNAKRRPERASRPASDLCAAVDVAGVCPTHRIPSEQSLQVASSAYGRQHFSRVAGSEMGDGKTSLASVGWDAWDARATVQISHIPTQISTSEEA